MAKRKRQAQQESEETQVILPQVSYTLLYIMERAWLNN